MSALRNQIKQFFETGDTPTQSQFETFFNSVRFNDEPIEFGDLSQSLKDTLNGLAAPVVRIAKETATAVPFNYTINQNFLLEFIVVIPPTTRSCTLSDDSGEVFSEDEVPAGTGKVWAVNMAANNADRHLTITDLPFNTQLVFITRKLTVSI